VCTGRRAKISAATHRSDERIDPFMTINPKSLREQVYEFLRDELSRGDLIPGVAINLNEISRELGISKTPLRDALLQLDTEGFVTIAPRRGVFVNRLALQDIKYCYEVIGALESAVILAVFDRIERFHLEKMKRLNLALRVAIRRKDFLSYYRDNILFHGVFLELSDNEPLKRIVAPMKQRLYDFPRRGYIRQWELNNCDDHDRLIEAFEKGERDAAVTVWRDTHWSFKVQEQYIRRFYFPAAADDAAGAAEDSVNEAAKGPAGGRPGAGWR
jgi:DNA-binding GntR family transcriptional regulator